MVLAYWQNLETHRMLNLPSPFILVYYSSGFTDNAPWFGHLLLETVILEFTDTLFVYFIQAAEYGVANFRMAAHLWTLAEVGRLRANEEVPVPFPIKMRADVLKRGLSRRYSNCAVDLVAVVLAFAHAGKIGRIAFGCADL